MTYFVKIRTKTYTSLQSTLSLSIHEKDRSEKRWSLSKIGFFRRRNNLSPCIPYKFAPRRAQKSLCNHEDPITGNSLSAIDLQQTCSGEYNHYLIASETDKGPIRICEKVVCLDKISVTTMHQPSTSADGLSRLDKFWPKRTNFQTHHRQNLSEVKTGQNRSNWQNFVYFVIHRT